MSQSESIAQIATALSAAQAGMQPAHLDKRNPHFKNAYASLASVIDAVRDPLAANGLSFVQTIGVWDHSDGIAALHLTTTLMHKSGEWICSHHPLPSNAKPQELGSALTYARRYSLSSICGIAADEDDDGEATRKVGYTTAQNDSDKDIRHTVKDNEGVVGRALKAIEDRKAEKGPLDD